VKANITAMGEIGTEASGNIIKSLARGVCNGTMAIAMRVISCMIKCMEKVAFTIKMEYSFREIGLTVAEKESLCKQTQMAN
jgi:hypothetical protein